MVMMAAVVVLETLQLLEWWRGLVGEIFRGSMKSWYACGF